MACADLRYTEFSNVQDSTARQGEQVITAVAKLMVKKDIIIMARNFALHLV